MATNFEATRVVLCGSFHRDRDGLNTAYEELVSTNCQVLSPHTLDFDDQEFATDKATAQMPARTLEDYHLMSIRQAHFIWLHAPGGYIGTSAAFEVGYALAYHIPVFSKQIISDTNLTNYITTVTSVFEARRQIKGHLRDT